jgi:hypothetical protein
MEVTMPRDDVYLALVKLDDEKTRAGIDSVSDLGDLNLTEDERQIVQDVIVELREDGEVRAFAGGAVFGAMNYCAPGVSPAVQQGNPPGSLSFGGLVGPGWGQASCGAGTCTADPKKKMPGEGGFGLTGGI